MLNEEGAEIPQSASQVLQEEKPPEPLKDYLKNPSSEQVNKTVQEFYGPRERRRLTGALKSAIDRARSALGMKSSAPSQPESPTLPTQQPPSTPTK